MKLKKIVSSINMAIAKNRSYRLFFLKRVGLEDEREISLSPNRIRFNGIPFLPPTTLALLLGAAVSASAAPPSPDINNDGFSDLIIGVPGDRDFGLNEGGVNMIRGSLAGLGTNGNQLWGQDSSGILGTGYVGNKFGAAVATGDFNGDGRSDLAVGSPSDTNDGGATYAGAVNIIYSSGAGLNATGNQLLNQKSAGILHPGTTYKDTYNHFGASLAAGDFNRDGYDDLAIGVPQEDLTAAAGTSEHGLVYVVYGSLFGLQTSTGQLWTQDSPGIAGVAGTLDHFGSALGAGDFDNDGYDDLAIGVPRERYDISPLAQSGAVHVLYGSAGRLSANRSQFWSQNSSGVLDTAENYDEFGAVLAVGDFNRDGRDDLAIGAPGERVTSNNTIGRAEGAVNVLYGTSGGLNATGNQFWTQNTPNIADQSEQDDRFGTELVAGDFNGDGSDDLAIGVPREDLAASTHYLGYGAVHVLFGGTGRLSAAGSQFWTQDSAGIADVAEDGDSFGQALGKGDYDGDGMDDLVIGVPGEALSIGGSSILSNVGLVHVLYGSNSGPTAVDSQVWWQNSPNILGSAGGGEEFGAALTH